MKLSVPLQQLWCFLLLSFFVNVAMPARGAVPVAPRPYSASYAVTYRGLNAGFLHFQLREEDGLFVYETRAEPTLLARLLVGGQAIERSVMCIDAQGVRPLFWFVEDGKAGNEQDGELDFVWAEGRVKGTLKGEPIDLPTEPGLQDRLSVQIAVMTALLAGKEPGMIPLLSDDEIKYYSYTRVDSGRLRTEVGELDTVLYEGTRIGSRRLSRFWQAPALGYIPVRVEQVRAGRIETVMRLRKVVYAESGSQATDGGFNPRHAPFPEQ